MNKINKDFIFKDNPRKITDKQLSRLERDLQRFGDLSGVVYCRKNKAYVGGNQRSKIFDGSQITLIKEYDEPLQDKTVAVGFIEWNGSKYLYREVEFSESEFREACIVANNDGGDWDFDLLQEWDMEELASWDFDTSFFNDKSNEYPTELTQERKEALPSVKITFKTIKQMESFEKELKSIIDRYDGAYYSVSAGEI